MRIIEVTNGLQLPITNEEADVYLKFDEDTPHIAKSEMSDREQHLANQLVNKNVLLRKNDQGKIIYKKKTG